MEYVKVGFIIMLTALIILLYYILGLLYIYIESRRFKNGKKPFRIRSIFDVRVVILLIIVLLLNTSKIFSSFYLSTFPEFEIEVSDNINDINFTDIYHEIKANIKVDKFYLRKSNSFSKFVIDKDGNIESLVISFSVPRFGYCIDYNGVYQDKKIVFNHTTYYQEYDQMYFDNNLINALELIDKTNLLSIIKFSSSLDYIQDESIKNYKFELSYQMQNISYWDDLPFRNPLAPSFERIFVLEPDGNFIKARESTYKNTVGVFHMYYQTAESIDNDIYEPGIVVFKNIS